MVRKHVPKVKANFRESRPVECICGGCVGGNVEAHARTTRHVRFMNARNGKSGPDALRLSRLGIVQIPKRKKRSSGYRSSW